MRRRAPKPTRLPGEYPESFVRGWMARALPSATLAEAASAVRHLRTNGWTEQQLAEFILPYMPRDDRRPAAPRAHAEPASRAPADRTRAEPVQAEPAEAIWLPVDVTRAWLDEHLPPLDRRELRLVVDELEHRGWPSGRVAMAALPHLLPKLSAEDARAVVSGLADLGMTEAEIARATTLR